MMNIFPGHQARESYGCLHHSFQEKAFNLQGDCFMEINTSLSSDVIFTA